MKKTERALRIIAGCEPAWVHWRLFFPYHEIPVRDKSLDSVQVHQDFVSARVRIEACRWLGKRLNNVVDDEAYYIYDSTMDAPQRLDDDDDDECFHDDVDEAEHAGPAPELIS